MSVSIKTDDDRLIKIEGTEASIGSDEACVIAFPGDDRIAFQHARLTKILFQWRIETLDGTQLSINDRNRGTGAFLQRGDCIALSPNGPLITFRPIKPEPDDESSDDSEVDENTESLSVLDEDSSPIRGADAAPNSEQLEFPHSVASVVVPSDHPSDTEQRPSVNDVPPLAQVVAVAGVTPLIAATVIPSASVETPPIAAADESWSVATDPSSRLSRRDSASAVSMLISAALGGATVFGIYKLLMLFGMI